MSKKIKEKSVKELSTRYANINHCFVVNYRGMDASKMNNFRSFLLENKIKVNVVKNSVLVHSLANVNSSFDKMTPIIDGPVAIVYSTEGDSINAAKKLLAWVNKNKLPEIKGGYVEGSLFGIADIKKLSQVPSRAVLLTQLAYAFQGPTTKLARALNEVISKFARVMEQKANKG